jgi:hypothetical protein
MIIGLSSLVETAQYIGPAYVLKQRLKLWRRA